MFKEFWIEFDMINCREFVYTEPVDGLDESAIHTVEYAALESANAENERLRSALEKLIKTVPYNSIEPDYLKIAREALEKLK